MANIRTELGRSGVISLNDATVRTLLGRASGSISMSHAYGKTKKGTPSGYFSGGYLYFSVTGAPPGAYITYELWYTTSGQPLGTDVLGYTDSSGSLNVSFNVTGGAYWYPQPKVNYYHVYQNGTPIGDLVIAS